MVAKSLIVVLFVPDLDGVLGGLRDAANRHGKSLLLLLSCVRCSSMIDSQFLPILFKLENLIPLLIAYLFSNG